MDNVWPIGAELGEGPVWLGDYLWFVDIKAPAIHRYEPATGAKRSWDAPQQVGFLFPVGDMQGYLNFKAYGEFAAENRPSGWNTWVTFSVSPPAPGAPPTTKPVVRKY